MHNRHLILDDAQLIFEIVDGNSLAFTELYNRYKKSLYIHAVQKLGDKDDAEDAVQEIFSKLWNNKADLQIEKQVSSYLFIALRNRILDMISKRTHQDKYLDSLTLFERSFDAGSTDHKVREEFFLQHIQSLISQYSEKSQKIFHLRVVEGLRNEEIAQILGISEKTVRNQFSEILRHLKTKLPHFIFLYFF